MILGLNIYTTTFCSGSYAVFIIGKRVVAVFKKDILLVMCTYAHIVVVLVGFYIKGNATPTRGSVIPSIYVYRRMHVCIPEYIYVNINDHICMYLGVVQ